MGRVIYLTGAPATGKTTLAMALLRKCPDLLVLSYSEMLREHIAERTASPIEASEVRRLSAQVVTSEDVRAVDGKLIERILSNRSYRDIIVDSHPVTKEAYGFRISPFSRERLCDLSPDAILCLYASPEFLATRIREDADGRPLPTLFELGMHVHLQATVASEYAVALGKTCYLLNSEVDIDELVERAIQVTKIGTTLRLA